MPIPRATRSPLLDAALELIGDESTTSELAGRFRETGAVLEPAIAEALLTQLADLGLVRVARTDGELRVFVPTSLGRRFANEAVVLNAAGADRLGELERMRTDMLATIAHELRTPLTAIRTCVGLLLDPAALPTDDQRRTLLETVERNADRMQRVVGDILDLARFRAGSIVLQLRRLDPAALARSSIASIAPLAAQHGQRIDLRLGGEALPSVYGDHRRLEQALVNLLSNAQKFAPDGGLVAVTVSAADGRVGWSVSDRGPGIPAEDQARLFERFFVGRHDESEAQSGVGLGLPTALAIAQLHGGAIEVVSEPGAGSTFTLVVPVAGPPEAE